jgi:hypothetical protein
MGDDSPQQHRQKMDDRNMKSVQSVCIQMSLSHIFLSATINEGGRGFLGGGTVFFSHART